jgi:hypothetical protein
MLLCTWRLDLLRFAFASEARHDLLLSNLVRVSSSPRCAFQWLPSCCRCACAWLLNQLAVGSLVLRGRAAAAFAQAVCIASIQVPPFAMVSAMLALHLSLYALRPSSVSSLVWSCWASSCRCDRCGRVCCVLLQFTCEEGQLDTSVVGVADRRPHVSAVNDALHGAPLHTEVTKLVSSAVAEGGGPGVVVFLFKACGCDDQVALDAGI